ncbi:hypothetical protein L6164_031757 [Bauhinia variegata]|uniref:Uncharacterized protein n=1 Tax=Bauhinia variegata TaxID=167791 RepID=A0ACB9KLI8_BAUVA|nr:hypothetical protein L6164_031757 [Bauhinia variegata]
MAMALHVFLVLSLCLSYNLVVGRSGISEQEGPPGSQANQGNDFDCVDIYEQPAFDHPLMKNHKIQHRPSFSIGSMKGTPSYVGEVAEIEQIRGGEGCPPGKVPIHRIKSNHLANADSSSDSNIDQTRHFATIDTLEKTTLLHGAGAYIGVYNPQPALVNQFSKAQVWLQRGPPNELNIIEVGWAVHRSLYDDNGTHLTAYWTIDNRRKTGCYNAYCPGFVQVDSRIALGARYIDISTVGGQQYHIQVLVKQDNSTGHWWLIYLNNIAIGYWPKELFSHMANGASFVRYGGETLTSLDGVSPPMGSGELPSTLLNVADYFAVVVSVDENYATTDVNPDRLKKNCDTGTAYYDLLYLGDQGGFLKQTFSFGGPGGKRSNLHGNGSSQLT